MPCNRMALWAVGQSPGREVMPVSVYEAMSVMFQFGISILALLTFVGTLLIYMHTKK